MNDLAALELRLRTLEAHQRRLRFLCTGSLALWVVSCLAAVAAPAHDELRARRFVLVDEQGDEHGLLSTDAGAPSLALWTGKRDAPTERVMLAAAGEPVELGRDEGPGTGLHLECGTASAMLVISKDGAGMVLEHDPDEETFSVLNLLATERGAGVGGSWNDAHDFGLFAEHDASRLTLSQPNKPGLDYDADEQPDVELYCGENTGTLTLRHDGQPTFRAPQ